METSIPPLPDKDFFNMGETCRITQVPAHTLRYWETNVGFLRPARRTSGHRRYGRADLETIFIIKDMIQRKKMTVAGARKALNELRKPLRAAGDADESSSTAAPSGTLKLLREVRKEIDAMLVELR